MGSSQQETFQEIASMLETFKKDDMAITRETDIARDLNLDSLAVMDFMMELEDKFDVSIPLNVVPEIQTVADLVATIHRVKEDA